MSCGAEICQLERQFCCGNNPATCLARPTSASRLTEEGHDFFEAGYLSDESRTSMGYSKYRAALRALCLDEMAQRVGYSADSDVRVCDDSSDCLGGSFCCVSGDDFGARTRVDCQQLAGGSSARTCRGNEICAPASRCVTPGTVCIEGTCRKAQRDVRCGDATCGQADLCCVHFGGEPAPLCAAKCSDETFSLDCDGPEDCPRGLLCCLGLGAQGGAPGAGQCKGSCDWGNEAARCGGRGCASDQDCAPCRAR
jgi:hypothetical protein